METPHLSLSLYNIFELNFFRNEMQETCTSVNSQDY
jgi:hypothetical protein